MKMLRFSTRLCDVVKSSFASRSIWTVSTCEHNLCLSHDQDEPQYLKYPFVWLRDNCQCPKCFHAPSNSRIIHVQQFNFDAVPKKAQISENHVHIEWTDKHVSDYPLNWLIERQLTQVGRKTWQENYGRKKQLSWTAKDFSRILKTFKFNKILERKSLWQDLHLKTSEAIWAKDSFYSKSGSVSYFLVTYDFINFNQCILGTLISTIATIVRHICAALKEGEVAKLADRVAFLKKTQYGEVFRVEAKPDTTNVAYLNGPLQLHTDLPYYEYKPGVNLLHCIVKAEEGGENQLADCLAVAKAIKSTNPGTYSILKDTPVIWSDLCTEEGRSYHSVHISPIIKENEDGIIERINFSQPQRDSFMNMPLEKVQCWYNALRIFSQKLYSPEYSVQYMLEPGQILTFDNIRLVHGRLTYEGERLIEGGYLDWDHIYSRLRILQSKYT
ncbi:gamma-butyrobetaine dioxygenase-like [Nilaparvata lugens]|uniref:gamma-butyrobetaine dioxygenase-like n=1 Tax=Nilaparvata lugens TaxID=108931 RepID=UPI00193DBF4D|nr:gamma-butyrobetaine dioxygenase-like [Nilaparvata lugens]